MSSVVSSNKFTGGKWTLIEKPLNEVDRRRNSILNDLGKNISNVDQNALKLSLVVIGDTYYRYVCNKLSGYIKFKETNIVNDKKKMTSREKILHANALSQIDGHIVKLKNYFNDINTNDKRISSYDDMIKTIPFIEIRVVILLKIMDECIKNKKDTSNKDMYELLIASKKILSCLKKYAGVFTKIYNHDSIELSSLFLDDFESKIKKISKKCDIKLYVVASKYPKMIFHTKYDMTISEIRLKPYSSQVEFMNNIKDNFDSGFLINLRALTGLGKTTSVISVCQYICSLPNNNNKVIFCCSNLLDTVRTQVANLMYNFQIKFSIGVKTYDDKKKSHGYILTKSYNCITKNVKILEYMKSNDFSKNEQALYLSDALVCDYYTTYNLLMEHKYDYTLFFDEPTIKIFNHDVMDYLVKILYNAPKRTILSSATLPHKNEMKHIESYFYNKYIHDNHGYKIIDINSSTVLIGCLIKDFNGNVITPHSMCKNKDELNNFIKKILDNPLLGKFYALSFLINLNEFMTRYDLNVDIDTIETFEHDSIMEQIIILLKRVCNNVCVDYDDFINIQCSVLNDRKINLSKKPANYDSMVYPELITKQASKFLGGCLISVDNPLEFVTTHFQEKINRVKDALHIKSAYDMYNEHYKMIHTINKQIENIDKNFKEEDGMRDEKIDEIMSTKKPFPFLTTFQVNTKEHITQFSNFISEYDESLLMTKINVDDVDVNNYNVSDDLIMLLFMGIGVYCQELDSKYCDKVIELLNDKKIAFVISDESLIYGSNNAFSNVIITDSIGEHITINELLQLIGRVGRVGKSYFGNIYIENNTLHKLINFLNDTNNNNDEGIEIDISFMNYLHNGYMDTLKKYHHENTIKTSNNDMEHHTSVVEEKTWRRKNIHEHKEVVEETKKICKVDYSKLF